MPVTFVPVPSSYATLVAEISGEEEFTPHNVKSDGAVVSMTAVISATEAYGSTDADYAEVVAQVTASESYGRSDSATVTMVSAISGGDIHEYPADAATVTLVADISADEVHGVQTTDADTVTLTAVPSGVDTREYAPDQRTVTLHAVISALDEHDFPADAGTAILVGIPSGTDLAAKWYADADEVDLVADVSDVQLFAAVDAATAVLVGVPSGTDAYGTLDAGTGTLVGVPSGTDSLDSVDAGTVTLVGVDSGVEDYTPNSTSNMLFFGGTTASDTLTGNIGGTASAGDIFIMGINSIDGDGANLPTVSDNIDSGWTKVIDTTVDSSTDQTRLTYWTKTAVGGETDISAVWGASTNAAFEGVWIRTPRYATPYVIDHGAGSNFSGTMKFTCLNAPATNTEPYIVIAGSGRNTSLTLADIQNPPGVHDRNSVGGNGSTKAGDCIVVCHINDQEDLHTTADSLTYRYQPVMNVHVAFFGLKP